jgi:radical SAM superfamily enzyme YgiQ (UPF0313 family)
VFSINLKLTKALLYEIARKNLGLEFSAELHLKNVDDEFIDLAAAANLGTLKFGIESAFDDVRKSVKRVSVDNDQQYSTIQRLKAAGIKSVGMFILAQPSDDYDTCAETIKYSTKLGLDIAQYSVFTPYPGTNFYNFIRDQVTAKFYEDFNQFKLVYHHNSLRPLQVRRLLEGAYKSFLVSRLPI